MKKSIIVDCIWAACFVWLAWSSWATTHNTLEHNGKWISSKLQLQKFVNGADSFVKKPQALAYNQLHLDAWNGFQEVLTKEHVTPRAFDFEVSLSPDSYIYAEFGHSKEFFSAFRLSVHPLFPTAFIIGKTSGEFVFVDPIDAHLVPDQKTQVTIIYPVDQPVARLYINTVLVKEVPLTKTTSGAVGFRGSLKPSSISHVRVLGQNNQVVFSDNFSYSDVLVASLFICSAFIMIGMIQILRHRVPLGIQVLSICGIAFIYGMSLYYSDKYPTVDGLFSFFWTKKESDWKQREIDGKVDMFRSFPPKKGYRIVFIGSSQTWGAGATSEKDTFVALSGTALNTEYLADLKQPRQLNVLGVTTPTDSPESASVEYVNAGVSAVNSSDLLFSYKTKWKEYLSPDMLVIDLSNNDMGNPKEFASNLREFVKVNGTDTKTVFVLEANSPEYPPDIAENHAVMNDVGRALDIPVIDLHTHLRAYTEKGMVWWDKVHLTDYGHQLAGNYLASSLVNILTDQDTTVYK